MNKFWTKKKIICFCGVLALAILIVLYCYFYSHNYGVMNNNDIFLTNINNSSSNIVEENNSFIEMKNLEDSNILLIHIAR